MYANMSLHAALMDSSDSLRPVMIPPISRKSLFEIWVENRKDWSFEAMFDFVLQQVEKSIEISLKSLIDHTVKRLCDVQQVFESLYLLETKALTIIIKWGCDGAEHSKYKQKFTDHFYVPLQMYSGTEEFKTILWQNPAISSTRLCHPIKFLFAKESVKLITTEVGEIEKQAAELVPTKEVIHGAELTINAKLWFCMIDGMVVNVVFQTKHDTCVVLSQVK
ncbi:hypothetical protein PR048_001310 [Dryococelus australis]|uniref:Uncharacterized protein n=1 Tax=Dryococelus australis TaxID=614101 RepID=A0ABQ9IGZ3_9NEOP|nr:hypothetical protein PR048_001310 [Dryococelus australis]